MRKPTVYEEMGLGGRAHVPRAQFKTRATGTTLKTFDELTRPALLVWVVATGTMDEERVKRVGKGTKTFAMYPV